MLLDPLPQPNWSPPFPTHFLFPPSVRSIQRHKKPTSIVCQKKVRYTHQPPPPKPSPVNNKQTVQPHWKCSWYMGKRADGWIEQWGKGERPSSSSRRRHQKNLFWTRFLFRSSDINMAADAMPVTSLFLDCWWRRVNWEKGGILPEVNLFTWNMPRIIRMLLNLRIKKFLSASSAKTYLAWDSISFPISQLGHVKTHRTRSLTINSLSPFSEGKGGRDSPIG